MRSQPRVVNIKTLIAQMIGEMTHRRKKVCRAWFAAPNVGRLRCNFGHENHVLLRVEIRERCTFCIELIAQDENQVSSFLACWWLRCFNIFNFRCH